MKISKRSPQAEHGYPGVYLIDTNTRIRIIFETENFLKN
jgi:hypothetical protein